MRIAERKRLDLKNVPLIGEDGYIHQALLFYWFFFRGFLRCTSRNPEKEDTSPQETLLKRKRGYYLIFLFVLFTKLLLRALESAGINHKLSSGAPSKER